jgi:hypothetical protein
MAEADWTLLDGSLSAGNVRRGASAGFTPPPGGGPYVFGFNSLDTSNGALGYFSNLLDFAPMAKGGSIRACVKRGLSGGPTGFAPFLFLGLQGPSIMDKGYLLGLSDADPCHISLRKGTIINGLSDLAPDPAGNGVLRRSSATFARDTWLHLRLDVIVNPNGDVRIVVFQNNLLTHPLSGPPSWQPITGMTDLVNGAYVSFVDDSLGINSGSAPFLSGRAGWAFQSQDVTRRAYFDHISLERQN